MGVVLGGNTARSSDRLMMALLNRGFSSNPSIEMADGRTPAASAAQKAENGTQESQDIPEVVKADLKTSAQETPETLDCVIEIGGNFSSQPAVRRILSRAIRTAPGLLTSGSELVVKMRGRHYRARFRRLGEREATQACNALYRNGFTCRIVRLPERENDLARVSGAQTAEADETRTSGGGS